MIPTRRSGANSRKPRKSRSEALAAVLSAESMRLPVVDDERKMAGITVLRWRNGYAC
jgi:hypothetical protein